ncbi:MAG: succinate dehydrogenase, hydrophobic membrane anchor protein [Rhizobiales bacterium]|nr:succinate dehydrogenase, hydrophobic membrane anchor protein [Hyphomicrobiales bacterium]
MSEMRTPLSRVHGLGSAKSGSGHFIAQRMTALALVPLAIFLLASLVAVTGADWQTAHDYVANPLSAILLLLFIGVGIVHMRLGMQVVIEDYVHGHGLKILALVANSFFAVLVGLTCIYAVLKIGFGS